MEENKENSTAAETPEPEKCCCGCSDTPPAETPPAEKKCSKRKKRLLWAAGIVLAVVLLLLFLPGLIVSYVVPPVASQILKVKLEIGSCFINVFDGMVHVKNVKIHNPAGYDSPYAFELGKFYIDVKMLTLISPKIEIADIIIEDMHATLEMKLGTNNLQDISNGLPKPAEKAEKKEEKKEPADDKEKKEPPKMVIRHFKISKSDFTMLKVPWPIPSMELTDVGDGKPITDFITVVYDAILDAVMQASKAVSDGVITVGKGIGKGVSDAGDAVVKGTSKALDDTGKAIKNIFSK